MKTTPLVEFSDLPYDCDIEVISLNGKAATLVLWFGGFKLNPDRKAILATKLPERLTLVRRPVAQAGTTPPKQYLYEPDPAFTKANWWIPWPPTTT